MQSPTDRRRVAAGWAAVVLSTAITCFWAFWGIVENFHEGWYYEAWLENVGLMVVQYLSPMLVFLGVTLASLLWPRLGAGLHGILALGVFWFLRASANRIGLFLMVPLLGLGALYWYGRPRPRRVALALVLGLPLLTLVAAGARPALRVTGRLDDGNLGARTVTGNGLTLTWAPEGPGWPRSGTDWHAAKDACRHLGEDGFSLSAEPQDTWRLPTVDEAVRSMARHGQNSGGRWDSEAAEASFEVQPDKESPLWSVHSQVIYWWTATESDADHAYIIVYDGQVWSRSKDFGSDYLGYRCIR